MRVLMADGAPAETNEQGLWPAIPTSGEEPRIERREYRMGSCWVGALEGGPWADPAPRPRVWLRAAEDGLAALLVRPPAVPTQADVLDAPVRLQTWQADLDGAEWLFNSAGTGALLGLHSSLRLPRWTAVSSPELREQGGERRIAAVPGDLAIAIAPAVLGRRSPLPNATWKKGAGAAGQARIPPAPRT